MRFTRFVLVAVSVGVFPACGSGRDRVVVKDSCPAPTVRVVQPVAPAVDAWPANAWPSRRVEREQKARRVDSH